VVAQESTVTGSIGVIFQTMNFSRGMGMIGIEGRALTSRKNKDIANPFTPPKEEHYAILQATVDEFYASFRGLVVERRAAMDSSRIEELTDGRVMTGKQALDGGLVDELGGVREAFTAAKRLAGIEKARLSKYHASGSKPMTAYASANGPGGAQALGGTSVDVDIVSLGATGAGVPRGQFLYLWSPDAP